MRRASAVALLVLAACGGGGDMAPAGRVPELPPSFTWPTAREADGYQLRVFRTDESLLFESGRLDTTGYAIDRDLRRRLLGAREFDWWVRHYDGERLLGRSDVVRAELTAGQR